MLELSSLFRVAVPDLSMWFFSQITDAHNCAHLPSGRASHREIRRRAQLRACSDENELRARSAGLRGVAGAAEFFVCDGACL